MKKLLLILVFLTAANLFAADGDTTFTAVLNEGSSPQKVSVMLKEYSHKETLKGKTYSVEGNIFTISIDGSSVSDTLPYSDSFGAELIDIDKNDKTKEILIYSGGSPDYNYWVYKYDKGIVLLLEAEYYDEFIPDGSGLINAKKWAGFCMLKDVYKYSKDRKKLEAEPVDFYTVKYTFDEDETEKDYIVTAEKSFKLYAKRNPACTVVTDSKGVMKVNGYDAKDVSVDVKMGDKLIISGYDSKYMTIKSPDGESEYYWVWIQMKTTSGKTGWILMNAYDSDCWNEYVSGVVFAG